MIGFSKFGIIEKQFKKVFIMKKNTTIFLLSSVIAFCGCNKEVSTHFNPDDYPVFSAGMEVLSTKTELGENNSVVWNAGDEVAVFNKNTQLLKYRAQSSGAETVLEAADAQGESGEALSARVAFYPYSASALCIENEGTFTVVTTVPEIQTYKSGSFGLGAAPMMAISSTESFAFKNVFGCLKLQFTGSGSVKSIAVTGNNGEALAGTVSVSMAAEGEPTFDLQNSSTTVTLDCGEGVALSNVPTPFYISLPARDYTKGITINVTMADESEIPAISTGASLKVGRSAICPMAACKLVSVNMEEMSKTNFKIEFCNSCLAYMRESYADPIYDAGTSNKQASGIEVPKGSETIVGKDGEGNDITQLFSIYGSTRYYAHTSEFYGTMGNHSPKKLIDGNTTTGWSSLRIQGNVIYGTLVQPQADCKESGFDDYDYTYHEFHSFGGRRRQTAIVVNLGESCNVASIGLINYNRTGGDGKDYGHIKSVEYYVSDDDTFKFTPAYGSGRKDYDYSNYANPNENRWTLVGKNTDLPVSKNEIQWVDVPYSLIASGKAKGRFLKIVFPERRAVGNDGATAYSAMELYVKKATNLD